MKLRWAPRMEPEKIRRLYEMDARGIRDEELLDAEEGRIEGGIPAWSFAAVIARPDGGFTLLY